MPRTSHLANISALELVASSHQNRFLTENYRATLAHHLSFSALEAAQPLWPFQAHAVQALLDALDPVRPKLLQLGTGGGKTRVANEVVARVQEETSAARVIWITKDWRLLGQAAIDYARRHRRRPLARVGGAGGTLHPLEETLDAPLTYTTVQTLQRRLRLLASLRPSLLVWDESHWGEHGGASRILDRCRSLAIPVLGLTATPRVDTRFEIAFSRTFGELVSAGYLARPVVEEAVRTGVVWKPTIRGGLDVSARSLAELANSKRRNHVIVETYLRNASRFGKTILFACSREHADRLASQLAARGVSARPVHSGHPDIDNFRALEGFRQGLVDVLVTVDMLTHGVDVPQARTVFLARPTVSDILFAQMIGRAARRDEATGKNFFHVVEFTDNVAVHGELFETSKQFFAGAGGAGGSVRPRTESRPSRIRRHRFDAFGTPAWIPNTDSVPDSARGLWYLQDQTFGIEIELATADGSTPPQGRAWRHIADQVRRALVGALPRGRVARRVYPSYEGCQGSKDTSVWNIEHDVSAGWEVTSPILSNLEGFEEVSQACAALDAVIADLGLSVDHRTGLHVHLGWYGRDPAEIRRALRFVRLLEPALATLVAPSRVARVDGSGYDLTRPNPYCRPVSSVFTASRISRARSFGDLQRLAQRGAARHVTFNVLPLSHQHTVEIRLHSGTTEARKILLWVSLWMQILWAVTRWRRVERAPDRTIIVPSGDIVEQALRWFPDARLPQQVSFLERLHARREEVRHGVWLKNPSLASWRLLGRAWHLPPRRGTSSASGT